MLGYHNISYLINASIYLVKGGRLGLMPGVSFHSCRPSFHHTGVMFPDFAFLTRLGDLWDPLDSSLWIKLLQQGPTSVSPFASPSPFSLGFPEPGGHLYFPPELVLVVSVGPTCQGPVATRGNSGLAYRKFGQSGVP